MEPHFFLLCCSEFSWTSLFESNIYLNKTRVCCKQFCISFFPTPSVIPRLGSTDDNSLPSFPRKEYLALGFLINQVEPNAFGYCRWVPQLYASLIQPFLFSSRRRCSSISTSGSAAPLPASTSSQRPWTRCPSSALHISTQTDFNIGLWWKRYRFFNFCSYSRGVKYMLNNVGESGRRLPWILLN